MPNSSLLFFQGTQRINAGLGSPIGDGLRCVGDRVVRLRTRVGALNFATHPSGGTRHYQVWYGNSANFCTRSTFNLSNGLSVDWTP